jgi:hypothetical protein
MSHPPEGAPFLFSLIASGWLARCAYTAAVLTIPDVVGDGEKTSAEVAQQLATSEDFTFRSELLFYSRIPSFSVAFELANIFFLLVLRALATGNIFEEVAPKKFKNNANSQVLRTGSPLRDMILLTMGHTHSRSWFELVSAVKTGKSGVTQAFGMDFWQ